VEVGCISGRRVSVPMPKIDHNKVETDQEGDGNAANNNNGNELCWEYSHCDQFVVG
jgi:hypothetical protein